MAKPDENPEMIDAEEITVPESDIEIRAPKAQTLAVAPQVQAIELQQRLDMIRDLRKNSMTEGVHYGKVPGTDKDTLLKPGAEELGVLFRLDVQPENEKRWEENGHLTVISRATVYDAPTGARIGSGEGICSTRERKYAKRKAGRECPECGAEAIIKGKAEYGGGWLCFGKKGGCGAKFADGTAQADVFETQDVGEIDNPDLPDLWNTCDKMASKRARVDAVLAVTGASAIFTQDLESDEAGTGSQFALATQDQAAKLSRAIQYLFPEGEVGPIRAEVEKAFDGKLYGPAAEAVCAVIRAHKANVDAAAKTNPPPDEADIPPDEGQFQDHEPTQELLDEDLDG